MRRDGPDHDLFSHLHSTFRFQGPFPFKSCFQMIIKTLVILIQLKLVMFYISGCLQQIPSRITLMQNLLLQGPNSGTQKYLWLNTDQSASCLRTTSTFLIGRKQPWQLHCHAPSESQGQKGNVEIRLPAYMMPQTHSSLAMFPYAFCLSTIMYLLGKKRRWCREIKHENESTDAFFRLKLEVEPRLEPKSSPGVLPPAPSPDASTMSLIPFFQFPFPWQMMGEI